MEERHHYNLNVVANNLRLFNVGSRFPHNEKVIVEFKFDDITFNLTGNVKNVSDFREGRSVEFEATNDELRRKLVGKEVGVKIFKGAKKEDNLLGTISFGWPKEVTDELGGFKMGSLPFFKDHEILRNNHVVGNIELTTQISFTCPEPELDRKVSELKTDKAGTLEVYKNIKHNIDAKDIFFVIGSTPSEAKEEPAQTITCVREQPKRYDVRLNTEQFLSMKGKIMPDFRLMGKLTCGDSQSKNKGKDALSERHIQCRDIFGDFPENLDKKEDVAESSESESDSCCSLTKQELTKDQGECRQMALGSDSEDNTLSKKHPQLTSECCLETLAVKEEIERANSLMEIEPPRVSNFFQSANTPCCECDQKKRTAALIQAANDDDIVQHWGENEKTFIRDHGFSKYDHCTCKPGTAVVCVYCAICKLRGKKEPTNFNYYVKEDLELNRNQVEEVCREVLSKKVPRPPRDTRDRLQKFDDTPKIAKMLDWLRTKCVSKKRLEESPYIKAQRLHAGAEKKTSESATHGRSGSGKDNEGAVKSCKAIKKLIDLKFDEDDMQFNDCNAIMNEWTALQGVRDKELKAACKKMCGFRPESLWRKVPRPLTKKEYIKKVMQRHGRRYTYLKRPKVVYASERHQQCHDSKPMVPHNMGWLWNLKIDELGKGWRPGRLRKPIRELMQYFLREFPVDDIPTTKELMSRRRVFVEPPDDLTPKPTLHVKKKDGKYLITMNPLKDPKTLQYSANPYANTGPIQFQIAKSPLEIKRRQVKKCLKDAGFERCRCGKPISECICRSFMEKQRLEKAVDDIENLLEVDNLKNVVVLSDTTISESQMNLEFTPPAGLMRPHLRGKRVDTQETQYDAGDFMKSSRSRTNEQVLAERLQKRTRKRCPGVIKVEPCMPKPREIRYPKYHFKRRMRILEEEEKLRTPIIIPANEGTMGIGLIGRVLSKRPLRKRGGADKPAEGKRVSNPSSHRSTSSKHALRPNKRCGSPVRITKPMGRWERFKRRQPVRPPWDNTIYPPPPSQCGSPKQKSPTPENTKPPSRKESPRKTNLMKYNLRNQLMARYGLKKDKACNTDFEEVEKIPEPCAGAPKKTAYHKNCTEPATAAPLKGVKSKQKCSPPIIIIEQSNLEFIASQKSIN